MKSHHAVQRLAAIAVLALCGCAAEPKPPDNAIAAATNAIAGAEDARAADYAPAEMHAAREKLSAARALSRQAADPKDPNAIKARWLAEEASADAGLAEARALDTRMQSVSREMQRTQAAPAPSGNGG